jgi:hypothetical protein
MSEYRPLTMRANRLLGASLVEHNLLSFETLESANERLLELMNAESDEPVSLLSVLTGEMQALSEQQVLQFLVEEMGLGLVDLTHYDQPDDLRKKLDLGACWATWSVPFDREEDLHFVATAFYLSPAVRSYWEKEFDGPIQWFATSSEQISDFLRKLKIERENLAAAAATVAAAR